MKTLITAFIIIISLTGIIKSQVNDSLVASPLIIPAKYAKFYDSAQTVYLPKGFQCSVFYTQSASWWPRMLAIDPSGRVCIADLGNSEVLALPDNDHDGAADSAIRIAYNDGKAHSIAFYKGALYNAASTTVMKFEHPNADGLYTDSSVFIEGIPNIPEGEDNHYTRTILFDTVGKNIFLSVGSPCNACREKDTVRGTILQFNLDGSGRRIYATGLRNAVGLTMDQATNMLWTSVAERNNLGENIPAEFATHVEAGGSYGWPLAYGDHQWVDLQADSEYQAMLPTTITDTALVNSMKVADIFFDAHSTPLSLAFYYGEKLPAEYTGNLFVTLHGSYPSADGRLIADGTKIMRAQKINDHWLTSDFAAGFLTDSINYHRWARPCGIVIDTSGDMYFSSDHTSPHTTPAIFKISYVGTNAVHLPDMTSSKLQVFPNPVVDQGKIEFSSEPVSGYMEITDLLGRKMMSMKIDNQRSFDINARDFSPGFYIVRAFINSSLLSTQFIVTRK